MYNTVPDMVTGYCLDPEGNGVGLGGGGEAEPDRLRGGKIGRWNLAKAGTIWKRTKKNSPFGCDGGGLVQTE